MKDELLPLLILLGFIFLALCSVATMMVGLLMAQWLTG